MSESDKTRQLFSQTAVYGIGIMLNRSVSFFLIPVYTKFFSPTELGVFTLVQSLSIFLAFLYAFGLETAFMKRFIDADNDERKSAVYSSTLIFLCISSVVLSLIVFLMSAQIAQLLGIEDSANGVFLIRLMSIVMIADTVYRIPLLYFRAQLRAKTYAVINFISFLVNIGMNLLLIVVLGFGVEAIFYSYLGSVCIVLIITLLMTRKALKFEINSAVIRDLLSYGFKFIFVGIFILVIDISDRFFLQYFLGEAEVGIYWANYRLASAMGLLIAAFKFSWTPFFLNLNRDSASGKIIANVIYWFVFTGSAMFLVFGFFIELIAPVEIFGIVLLGKEYLSGLSIIPVILLSYFFAGLYAALNAAPFFTDNTRSLLYISGAGMILNLILNFLLIPKLGMMGAAYATLATYILMSVVIFFYSQRIYRIDISYVRLTVIFGIAIIVFVIGMFVVNRSDLGISSKLALDILLVAVYCGAIHFLGAFRLGEIRKLLKGNS